MWITWRNVFSVLEQTEEQSWSLFLPANELERFNKHGLLRLLNVLNVQQEHVGLAKGLGK